MVISLESQNVKVKRSVYLNKKRLFNFKININNFRSIKINIPNMKISIISMPYYIGLFCFLLFFSGGYNLFIYKSKVKINIEQITLPNHEADILSRELIIDYESKNNEELYIKTSIYRGETLSSLSSKYGVSRETILNVNGVTDIKKFFELDSILIPKYNGYLYKISPKDTLESISKKFNVELKDIFRVNNLKSNNIGELKSIFLPDIIPSKVGWNTNINKFFVYPIDGYITKRFGYFTNSITGITSLYEGIDFSPSFNTDVYASKSGYISRIGYNANYGNYLYIDHSSGFRTLYAHLDEISGNLFDDVSQGEVIGKVGKSGFTNSTKLFFSILNKDDIVNPEDYLK